MLPPIKLMDRWRTEWIDNIVVWTNRRVAKQNRKCSGCGRTINPGDIYLQHVASPGHGDNPGFWRVSECKECAIRYGHGQYLASKKDIQHV